MERIRSGWGLPEGRATTPAMSKAELARAGAPHRVSNGLFGTGIDFRAWDICAEEDESAQPSWTQSGGAGQSPSPGCHTPVCRIWVIILFFQASGSSPI